MGENTEISWCDHTFNPWEGCQKVGPGCDNCYAEARNKRYSGQPTAPNWGPGAPRRRTSVQNWKKPLKWNREAEATGTRPRVFCASLADIFDNAAPTGARDDLWTLIDKCQNLDWLIVTKRVGNVKGMIPDHWKENWPSNVWLLITVCNQEEADRDIPKLINLKDQFGVKVAGLSMEPLLGPVSLRMYLSDLDWIIVGGEDGPRPIHPDWARDLQKQCYGAHVPFHFKQWGAWHEVPEAELPKTFHDKHLDSFRVLSSCGFSGDLSIGSALLHKPQRYPDCFPQGSNGDAICNTVNMKRIGKRQAGSLLDGVEHKETPV